MKPFKIQLKLGQFEFSAEGDEDSVKAQLEAFMKIVQNPLSVTQPHPIHPPAHNGHSNDGKGKAAPTAAPEDVRELFNVEKDIVTIRIHPKEKEGERGNALGRESLLLLLYGFKRIFGVDDVGVMKMTSAMTKSGVRFKRLNDLAHLLDEENLITKTGTGRGTTYRLTTKGLPEAEKIAAEVRALRV